MKYRAEELERLLSEAAKQPVTEIACTSEMDARRLRMALYRRLAGDRRMELSVKGSILTVRLLTSPILSVKGVA